ncbi:DNA polymerase III subunit delta', partial [bacterium]|nr:DNA polymerase III subunit delta' [bacterium]
MTTAGIIGQNRVRKILKQAFLHERVAHAYLFQGPRGTGKVAAAIEFTQALLCQQSPGPGIACGNCSNCIRIQKMQHPDVSFIYPTSVTEGNKDKEKVAEELQVFASLAENPYRWLEPGKNPILRIYQIRDLKRAASLKSFEGKGRVAIFPEIDRMNESAANSFLKLLEEPPDKMYFIMTSSKPNRLLDTVISRCQLIQFSPLQPVEIEDALQERQAVPAELARLISRIANGNYRRALELTGEDIHTRRRQVVDILRIVLRNALERLILAEKLADENTKTQMLELLSLILVWFRDAMVFSEMQIVGGNSDSLEGRLVNI